jgi:hypothetical protein
LISINQFHYPVKGLNWHQQSIPLFFKGSKLASASINQYHYSSKEVPGTLASIQKYHYTSKEVGWHQSINSIILQKD